MMLYVMEDCCHTLSHISFQGRPDVAKEQHRAYNMRWGGCAQGVLVMQLPPGQLYVYSAGCL